MAGSLADLLNLGGDAAADLQKELDDRRKKALAVSRVGSPGKISTMMGYSGNTNPTGSPFNMS